MNSISTLLVAMTVSFVLGSQNLYASANALIDQMLSADDGQTYLEQFLSVYNTGKMPKDSDLSKTKSYYAEAVLVNSPNALLTGRGLVDVAKSPVVGDLRNFALGIFSNGLAPTDGQLSTILDGQRPWLTPMSVDTKGDAWIQDRKQSQNWLGIRSYCRTAETAQKQMLFICKDFCGQASCGGQITYGELYGAFYLLID